MNVPGIYLKNLASLQYANLTVAQAAATMHSHPEHILSTASMQKVPHQAQLLLPASAATQRTSHFALPELPAVAEKDLTSLQHANLTVIQASVTSVDVGAKVSQQHKTAALAEAILAYNVLVGHCST